ncbi:hypothetical protein DPSP01_005357 [Paraphaeosphaeria sporulosa]
MFPVARTHALHYAGLVVEVLFWGWRITPRRVAQSPVHMTSRTPPALELRTRGRNSLGRSASEFSVILSDGAHQDRSEALGAVSHLASKTARHSPTMQSAPRLCSCSLGQRTARRSTSPHAQFPRTPSKRHPDPASGPPDRSPAAAAHCRHAALVAPRR